MLNVFTTFDAVLQTTSAYVFHGFILDLLCLFSCLNDDVCSLTLSNKTLRQSHNSCIIAEIKLLTGGFCFQN